jgi:hypothetical protein
VKADAALVHTIASRLAFLPSLLTPLNSGAARAALLKLRRVLFSYSWAVPDEALTAVLDGKMVQGGPVGVGPVNFMHSKVYSPVFEHTFGNLSDVSGVGRWQLMLLSDKGKVGVYLVFEKSVAVSKRVLVGFRFMLLARGKVVKAATGINITSSFGFRGLVSDIGVVEGLTVRVEFLSVELI